MWELHPKGVYYTCLKIFFYGDHSSKYYKVFKMAFIIIFTFYFVKASYSHMMLLQVLIQLTTWNYWMQIMSQKLKSLPFIYLKERSGWIVNHIHLHLFPMYQTNHQMSLITFHLFMNRLTLFGVLDLVKSTYLTFHYYKPKLVI